MGYEPIAAVAETPWSAARRPPDHVPSQTGRRRGERVVRRSRWPVATLSFAAMLLLLLGLGAVAYRMGPGAPSPDQTAMPAAIMAGSPATSLPTEFIEPRPAACEVAPRTREELRELSATSRDEELAIRTPLSLDGPPADPATVEAIIRTVREVYVCLEIGDQVRVDALLTGGARSLRRCDRRGAVGL